jgi:hypothetical protein
MKNNTVKAVRATITLGDIEIEGYQMPDGSYKLSQSSTTLAVNKPPKRMVQLARSEKGQSLVALGFEKGLKVAVENSKPVVLVDIEVAFQFWVLELSIGNLDALALVSACGVESIERRLDAAFGKIRTEEERNERLKNRQNHREDFHPKFTTWLRQDGCEGNQYAIEFNNFKRLLGLPIVSVVEYDSRQLRILDVAYIKYDTLRTTGLKHNEVLRSI